MSMTAGSVDLDVNVDIRKLHQALSIAREFEATMTRIGAMANAIPEPPYDHNLAVARGMITPGTMGTATVPRNVVREYRDRGLLDLELADAWLESHK